MHNDNETRRKKTNRGPMAVGEKAKDFKASVKRLFKELKNFKILIFVALVLAAGSSVLSILAPNKLSDLTDEISQGLIVDSKNLEVLTEKITSNMTEEKLGSVVPRILDIRLNQETIVTIMSSNEISTSSKTKFQEVLLKMQSISQTDVIYLLEELDEDILKIILPETTYKDEVISTKDKLKFISVMKNSNENFKIPESISKVIFDEIEVDDVKVSSTDQVEFLGIFSTVNEDITATSLYKKIDEMPESVQKIVEPFMDMDKIKSITLFLVIIYLLSALFHYIESITMTTVANKFAKSLRSRISTKINRLPLKYFDKNTTGDILSRVTNDVDTIAQSMNHSLAPLVSSTTLLFGTIIMMFITNWIMAITAIGASLLGFIFMSLVLSKSQKYFVARQEELGDLNGHIEEVYSSLNVVKAYNGKKQADKRFNDLNEKLFTANRMSQFLSGLMMPMMGFVGNFGYVAVCIVGALLTMNDYISFGVIVAFITYVRLFTSPLSDIAQSMTSLQSTAAASERVFEFLDEVEMTDEKNIKTKLNKSKVKGQIQFKNVQFTYDGNDTPTIKDFSALAKPGQKVAIVGPTGAGKTTMVNLLMKFYEVTSGDIIIDGVSTKRLTRENIHSLFTMVLQDTWLFEGTIKENIIYNQKNISDEKVKEVCKTVGLDHFIKTLPKGYDSDISNNDSVSSGQRQLLTIARGMLEEAPFLILDEATSNVDTRTEELVQKAMDKLTKGKTSFIIAHRLSTIKNADLILVMKDGNIIEQGNHKQLMKKNGFYAELYNSQFEL